MKLRNVVYGLFVLLIPSRADGQVIDTAQEVKKLVGAFKALRNMGYDYVMNASFPNGEKDNLKGNIYLNNDSEFYYNDCNAFTMIYTRHWLYKADHREKILTIVNLDKEADEKQKNALANDIFKNSAVTTFLDSILLKTSRVKRLAYRGDTLFATFGFPRASLVQKIDLAFDQATSLLVSYEMKVAHPWERTAKGVRVIESTIKCTEFKEMNGKANYGEDNFFSYNNGKLEIKKYNNYKLSQKM